MPAKSRHIAVIGLGTFGVAIARELTRMGDRVIGIDNNVQLVSAMCDDLESAVEADATDFKALSECSLNDYDAVIVSIGENIEASILAAMNVLELGCKNVWVKAQTQTQKKILEAIGVNNVILPEESFGTHLAQIVHNPRMTDYLTLGSGEYIAQVTGRDELVGTSLADLKINKKFELTCIGIQTHEGFVTEIIQERIIQGTDILLLYGTRHNLRRFLDGI